MDVNVTVKKIAKELTEQQKKMKDHFDGTKADEAMGQKIKEIAKKWKNSDQKGNYQDFVKKELSKTDVDEKMKKEINDLSKNAKKIAKELTEQQKKMKDHFDSTNADEAMGQKIKEIAKKWKNSDQKGNYQDFVKKELSKTDVDEKMKKQIDKLKKDAASKKLPYNLHVYIQEEKKDEKGSKPEFVVYVKTEGGTEFYKVFETQQQALKEFKDIMIKATKGYTRI